MRSRRASGSAGGSPPVSSPTSSALRPTPPMARAKASTWMLCPASSLRATAPAATLPAVSRPEERPPPR